MLLSTVEFRVPDRGRGRELALAQVLVREPDQALGPDLDPDPARGLARASGLVRVLVRVRARAQALVPALDQGQVPVLEREQSCWPSGSLRRSTIQQERIGLRLARREYSRCR